MLSTENPPPDLCEISQLKSGSDERASETNKQQLEVDLFKPGLDYNNPLPNFSIRDYVFNTRGKDIKNNWPFSQKNLQLCLKHGVKDVLPPFQSLDYVRNPSVEERVVASLRYSDVKYPELSDGSVRKRPAVNIENINSSECEEDREFPSTTTSPCSDINSVLPIRNSWPEPVSRSDKPQFAVRESKKTGSNIQSPVKKCRLIVKLNNIAEPKSNEDSAVNTPVVSETMTSKVCPVCKTFSSSSNTTLNAHIDQCLSGESTVKWTTNAKVIKHRIKPRKTRLMVDIYETALSCTLEDLDKRNGTNWASNMGLHPQDLDASVEEEEDNEKKKEKTYSPVDFEDINQEGDVYIDSSGTKLRILSKLNHPPSKLNVNDSGGCQFVKRDKGVKLLSSKKKKKKKHTVQRAELQKNSLDGQGSCSPAPNHLPDCPPHGPKSCFPRVEVNNGQQKLYPSEGHKEDDPTKSPLASDHMKSDDFGMIKQWVGSKRTGLKKKINLERENQHLDKSLKNMRIKSVSSLGDRGISAPISPISSDENPVLPPEGLKRKENLCRSIDGWTELPCLRKGPAFSLLRSEHLRDKKNHLMSSKFNVKQSRKEHEHLLDPPNHAENHAPPRSNKKTGISCSPTVKNDSLFIGSSTSHHRTFSSEGKKAKPPRKMSVGHAMSSGGRKFSSLRTKLLSVRHASDVEPKKNLGRDLLSFKNPWLGCSSRSDEDAVVSQSKLHAEDMVTALGENAHIMENDSGALLTNRTRVLKIRKRIGGFVNMGEGDMTSNGSETSPESDNHNVGKKIDSFICGSTVPVDTSSVLEEEAEMLDDFVCEPASTDGEAFVSFSKSLDSAFPGLAGSNVECVSQYYNKAYDRHCPIDQLVFHADQEMFCADNVGKNLVTSESHEMAEMDGDDAQGNYFVDVDPIPIPGPPGSFLPSPGRMGSEELLGHSSLTTCRIQSSDDGHEVVDMDSSDSPISAMSTVSNSVAGRSSSVSTTNLSAQSHFQHETHRDITEGRNNLVVEGSSPSPFEQIASGERELNLLKSKANVMLPEVTREVQPCCCSRKDASLQGGSLNYQESQILRRRAMTSLSVLAQEKQINAEIRCIDLRAETVSEKVPTPVTGKDVANYAPEALFRGCGESGDFEFPSPSTSNPVLRLMGKNLMVVNKDDHLPTQSGMMIEHPGVENGRNNPNEPNSYHHMLSRDSSMLDNIQAPRVPAHQFDFNSSDAFKIPANYRPSQLSSHPSTPMFPGMSFGDNATSASRCHEYAGGFSFVADHELGSKMRPYARTTYDAEKVGTHLVHFNMVADSCAGKSKEIIIIDDSPENEAGLHCSTNVEVRESVGMSCSLAPDSRHVNPFYNYEMRVNSRFTGSPMVASRNTIVLPPSKGINNANIGKWNCIPEGSNSSTASLPSSVHQRSLYFSPGFS